MLTGCHFKFKWYRVIHLHHWKQQFWPGKESSRKTTKNVTVCHLVPCGADGMELVLLLTAPLLTPPTPCTSSKGRGAFSCLLSLKHSVVVRIPRWYQDFYPLVYPPCIISPLSVARACECDGIVISLRDRREITWDGPHLIRWAI